MKHELKNKKIPYILLALLVAVVFWLFVDEFGDNGQPRSVMSTITDIPITYVGEDDLADRGLMLVDEGTSATVDLTLRGPAAPSSGPAGRMCGSPRTSPTSPARGSRPSPMTSPLPTAGSPPP